MADVGLCGTCRHWSPCFEGSIDGYCGLAGKDERIPIDVPFDDFGTRSDFGCICHSPNFESHSMPSNQVDIALKVDGIERARIAMEALTDAAEKAKRAIADLQGHSHGGITIKMLGEAVLIEIKPPVAAS